jgi:hypothetical protein
MLLVTGSIVEGVERLYFALPLFLTAMVLISNISSISNRIENKDNLPLPWIPVLPIGELFLKGDQAAGGSGSCSITLPLRRRSSSKSNNGTLVVAVIDNFGRSKGTAKPAARIRTSGGSR